MGETLHAINRGFCNRRLGSLAASGRALYINSIQNSASSAILRLSDSEQTWVAVPSLTPLIQDQVVRIVSANSRSLYILTVNGLVASNDAGRSWHKISTPSTSPLTDLLIPGTDGHRILLGAGEGVFQTENDGHTWNPTSLPEVNFGAQIHSRIGPEWLARSQNPYCCRPPMVWSTKPRNILVTATRSMEW